MLGKLLKYDLLHSSKKLSVVALIESSICLLFSLTMVSSAKQNGDCSGVVLFFSIAFCFIFLPSVLVICLRRFYKNLFKSEGYLTFTIPARTELIILSKILNYVICSIISIIFCWTLVFLLNYQTFQVIKTGLNDNMNLISSFFNYYFKSSFEYLSNLIVPVCIHSLLSFLNGFLIICLSIASIVLVNRYKWLVAVGTYFGTSILLRSINSLILSKQVYSLTAEYYNLSSIVLFVFIIGEFFLISWLCKKKLNLQ